MTEALAGLEYLNDLALVDDVHGPAQDQVQPAGGQAILHEGELARCEGYLDCLSAQRTPGVLLERIEGRARRENRVQLLQRWS